MSADTTRDSFKTAAASLLNASDGVSYTAAHSVREATLLARAVGSINRRILELHYAGLSIPGIVAAMQFYEGVRLSKETVRYRLQKRGLVR